MERIDDIKKYLANQSKEQFLVWQVFEARAKELLATGFNGRLTITFSNHMISDLKSEDFIMGSTNIEYNFIKSSKVLDNLPE